MSQQPKTQSFTDTQFQFANAIRDPENNAGPDKIEQRRMTIYRELFYNNIEGFIANGFPVLRGITSDEAWHSMIRDFMIKHRCKTPLFHEISREFLAYLNNERKSVNDPIFIKELTHYEWVELALSVSDAEVESRTIDLEEDILQAQFNSSPLAWPLVYHFPVHQIGPDFQPQQAGDAPTYLLVYRNKEDDVTFLELNPVSTRLIELLNEGLTGQAAAEQIAQELQHQNPEVVIEGARGLITDWLQREILV
ncbi:MAG: DUF2063 domain-containing protein [Methylophaga sp.]|nr:DUF2063 domain-containing protein [Methylophaga sp.]